MPILMNIIHLCYEEVSGCILRNNALFEERNDSIGSTNLVLDILF